MSGVCLVTGGARGIGRATVRQLAGTGDAVAIGCRERSDAALALAAEILAQGGRAAVVQGDVAKEADVVRMFEETERALGPVTALVNSAGIGHGSRVADFVAADLERLFAVNVVGAMLCCREAARRMSTARGGLGGAIVNVSSMAATVGGRPGASAYAASKGALDVFSKGFAREVAKEGIRVNVVRPGVTRTDMTQGVYADPARLAAVEATIAMGRTGLPEEVAEAIVWLLSPRASFVAGAFIDAGGGGFVVGGPTR